MRSFARVHAAAAATVIAGAAACASGRALPAPAASAPMMTATGATIGTATLTSNRDGSITIRLNAMGLPTGTHGIHIHSSGSCTQPDFASAGAHFNPTSRLHGLDNSAGPHSGDLPNLAVNAGGRSDYSATTARVTVAAGQASLFDADGSALVIHAAPDDNRTDPSGNSGDRIACGVIRATQ